jgi:fatty acid desaturase
LIGCGLVNSILYQILCIHAIKTWFSWCIKISFSSPVRLNPSSLIDLFFDYFRVFEGTWFGMLNFLPLSISSYSIYFLLVVVTQSNHVVMDVSHDDVKSSWFRMQLKATCNIEKSNFNDWFTGHLNFQIEHQYVYL